MNTQSSQLRPRYLKNGKISFFWSSTEPLRSMGNSESEAKRAKSEAKKPREPCYTCTGLQLRGDSPIPSSEVMALAGKEAFVSFVGFCGW